MARRTRSEVWDRHAPRYDAATAWVERRFLADGRRWVCPRATGRTLEVGVGTGANVGHYPPDVELIGIDPSAGMLAEAGEKAARSKAGAPVVELLLADVGDLPFEDGTFDSVVATYVLCCVPDLPLALTEIVRVLRPGGQLLLADHVRSTVGPVRLAQRALEAVTIPMQEEHFTRRPAALLEGVGLQIVESSRVTLGALERVRAVRPVPG